MPHILLETSPNNFHKLNTVALQSSLSELVTMIATVGEKAQGTLELDEVNLSIKISPQGDIILLNGSNTKQAIEIKFKRIAPNNRADNHIPPEYLKLSSYLATCQWQMANLETWDLLCQAIGKKPKTKLTTQDMQNIPCTTITAIDQLWHKYSGGKFGFKAQRDLYRQVTQSKILKNL